MPPRQGRELISRLDSFATDTHFNVVQELLFPAPYVGQLIPLLQRKVFRYWEHKKPTFIKMNSTSQSVTGSDWLLGESATPIRNNFIKTLLTYIKMPTGQKVRCGAV